MAYHADLNPVEVLDAHCDEVGVSPPDVVEKDGDLAGGAEAEFAPLVSSATILHRDILMIADLVRVVGGEGLVAYVAFDFLDELVPEPIVPLETLLVVV